MSINFPDPNITQEFTAGNGITYLWDTNDSKWVIKNAGSDSLYVQRAGDTMTGALVMDDAGEIKMQNTHLDFVRKGESLKDTNGDPVLDADGKEQWDAQVNRFSTIESMTPRLLKEDGTTSQDTSTLFGIDFNLSGGNTYKNTLQASAKEGWIFRMTGGGTPTINFNDIFDLTKNPSYGIDNGVAIRGIPTPGENTPSDFAVNKDYVDTKDEDLRQDIIEIEEELEAIAPSLERGRWLFNPIGAAGVGQYGLFALGTSTNEYPQADHLFINSVDSTGKIHNFDDVGEGTYLEVFSPTDGDFGLYQIVENNGETQGANAYWDFTLNHLQSNRLTADAEGACRFKFFELAEGADPNTFVLKRGDTMSGDLTIDRSEGGPAEVDGAAGKEATLRLKGDRVNNTDAIAKIVFENASSTQQGFLTFRSNDTNARANAFFKLNQNLQINNKLNVNTIDVYSGDNLDILNYSRFADGLVVKKENELIDGNNIFAAKPQWVRTFEEIDASSNDNTVVHKKYVDDKFDFSKYTELS